MIFKIDIFLCLFDIFDLLFVAVVAIRIIFDLITLIYREVKAPQIFGRRGTSRCLLHELVKDGVIVIKMTEHLKINFIKSFLDLMLGTAEIIERIKQQTRNRECQDDYYPDLLECAVRIPCIDTQSGYKRNCSEDKCKRRVFITEQVNKNGKSNNLRNDDQTVDNYSADAVFYSSFAFYRSFSHYPIFSINALYPRNR